jgi:surface antigen
MRLFLSQSPVRILAAIAVIGLTSIAAGGSAHAQYGAVFGTIRPGPGDQQMVRERVQTLLDGPADPRSLEWQNPRSGNGGTVSLMSEITRRGQQCRQVEYHILQRAHDRPEVAILLWCKQPSGRWAILN